MNNRPNKRRNKRPNKRPNKNIIGDHCDIRGKSIVGDNSGNIGNGQSNNNNSNNELLPYTRIDDDCIRVNSNMNSEVNSSFHGGNKNFIGAETRIEEDSIVGDWSGNINGARIPTSPIMSDNARNSPSRDRVIGFCGRKNEIGDHSQISGHCIVADNSCNIGNINDIPNCRGNNNMEELLKARFECKNIIESSTNIRGNSIVGDVSGNTMNIPSSSATKTKTRAKTKKGGAETRAPRKSATTDR